MRGMMIYERGNVARNQRFIELFMAAAKRRGATLELVMTDETAPYYENDLPCFKVKGEKARPDFVIMRCMRPLLSAHLENMGIPVFNNARVSALCNDKRKTAAFFAKRGLPFVSTAFVSALTPAQPFEYPIVAKAAHGCGGRQVYLCQNEEQYLSALQKIAPDAAIAQPFLNAGGQDVRVYVLGGQIRACMQRYSNSGDFRSNFGINGLARPYKITEEISRLTEKAVDGLSASLVGVDFLMDAQGKIYLNEIEDAVGTRMLYQYTDMDVVDEYMALIARSL